ncbi:molybdopterin molybdotransferase MoeA [Xanthomonas maliensis]|uniref:molybdopterin molybdotransferase MoeA n=1 Tax=Xanthomonas maliensis TaxID=1321368 RepID=UPI00039C260F|nr:molybdopterin molybdotransferase MoeA [Xanthomonas maliensis]KAB7771816.1 molybdopterin molybdenumtransferase MoeA [Xanthomonas maliensis]
MISYAEALACVLQQVRPLASEWVSSADAEGRVVAVALSSASALPAFDNSAMDGFALATAGQGVLSGSEHAIGGVLAAGQDVITVGCTAWEIMTGAVLPAGADTVVALEDVERLPQQASALPRIRVRSDVAVGRHIRRRGEDVAVGDTVIAAGTVIRSAHQLLLASLGCAQVCVVRRPRVAVIATGRELVDDPTQALQPGQIHDGTSAYLRSQLRHAGAELLWHARVGDTDAEFDTALAQARQLGVDLVLSTGAVSRGRYDFIPGALARHGAQLLFHKVAVRPGKPVLLARLPDGTLYAGLPGNPMASAAGLRFFVEPALRGWLGLPPERGVSVALDTPLQARPLWRQHLRAQLHCSESGVLAATILPQQESFRLMPLLQANVWAVVSPQVADAPAQTRVEVYGLGHLQPPTPESPR